MSTLQDRLTQLLAGPPKISQAALARACGIKPPSVHDWISGKTKSIEGENLLKAAVFLKVSPYWLATGKGSMADRASAENRRMMLLSREYETLTNEEKRELLEGDISPLTFANTQETDQPFRRNRNYPLISEVVAGVWAEACDNFQPGDAEEWIASDENAGDFGYWLAVKGKSMFDPSGQAPLSFPHGYRILVQPEGFDVISGKFYVARLRTPDGKWETTFKQYIRDAGVEYLQPINPAFDTIRMDENVEIIGRVIDSRPPKSSF